MTIRQPGDVVGLCPVCRAEIDLLNPDQIPTREGETLDERIEHVVEANEALILTHATASHSLKDVMIALGAARTGLQQVFIRLHETNGFADNKVLESIRYGLGEGE